MKKDRHGRGVPITILYLNKSFKLVCMRIQYASHSVLFIPESHPQASLVKLADARQSPYIAADLPILSSPAQIQAKRSLRRQLLIDPHILKKGTPDLAFDNPLSQDPGEQRTAKGIHCLVRKAKASKQMDVGMRCVSAPSPAVSRLPSIAISRHSRRTAEFLGGGSWPKRRPRLICLVMGNGSMGQVSEAQSSFYELLGVPESGSYGDIKRAYKQLALKYHPDVSPPDLAREYTQRFIRVKEAYETLSDPRHRASYDRHLADAGIQPELEEKFIWRNHWEDQLMELYKMSTSKINNNCDYDESLSWGDRMRLRMQRQGAAF